MDVSLLLLGKMKWIFLVILTFFLAEAVKMPNSKKVIKKIVQNYSSTKTESKSKMTFKIVKTQPYKFCFFEMFFKLFFGRWSICQWVIRKNQNVRFHQPKSPEGDQVKFIFSNLTFHLTRKFFLYSILILDIFLPEVVGTTWLFGQTFWKIICRNG